MFIVIEGLNGTGKTTLINNLAKKGYKTLSSPGGTPLAQMLRPACRGAGQWADIDKRIQFLLFSAARMDEYLRMVKDIDEVVIVDRWWTSSYVYQCRLQSIPIDFLHHTIPVEEKVDLVIILTGDFDVLVERLKTEREANPAHSHCTWSKDLLIMRRVYDIYNHDLPAYLDKEKVSFDILDVTELSKEQVFGVVEKRIELQKEGSADA